MNNSGYKTWTPQEWIDKYKEAEDLIKKDEVIRKGKYVKLLQLRKDAEEIWGKFSKPVKYLNNCKIDHSYTDYKCTLDRLKDILNKEQKEIADKKATELGEKLRAEYRQKALIFLSEKGLKLGTDFDLEETEERVDEIYFDELIEAYAKDGGWNDFSGDDYCENCAGWDGKDHRCDCGNRRVDWTREGHWPDGYIYGEAY